VFFQLVEDTAAERQRRWLGFGGSSLLQALMLFLLVRFGILLGPGFKEIATKHRYQYFQVMLPVPGLKPVAPLHFKPAPRTTSVKVPTALWAPPRLAPPPQLTTTASRPLPEPTKADFNSPPAPGPSFVSPVSSAPPTRKVDTVRTDVFAGSSAKPTVNLPIRKVETGGFGSPDGLPGEAAEGHPGNVAKLGSFDLPQGPGNGNGLGGAQGARGTVASAGFGNGYATSPGAVGQETNRRAVKTTEFDDVRLVVPASKTQPTAQEPPLEPMEILVKPNPSYSEEARRMKIQGEVVIGVVFEATGKVRVVRVLQGLGHGLDEAALRAAEQIRFRPARRGNQPVDFPATLRIIFQLAA
jgi:TonB family protein